MTVSSLCNDMLILAVFMLAGFFIREIFKPVQKLFLPSSLIGGLLLLLLGHQAMGIIAVPESFHELPGVLIDMRPLCSGLISTGRRSVPIWITPVLP